MRKMSQTKIPSTHMRYHFENATFSLQNRFQKNPLWEAFSTSCVFGHRFHCIRVDDSRIRNKNFLSENTYVWTGSKCQFIRYEEQLQNDLFYC